MTELTRLTACAAVDLLERREVSPLDLVEAAAARIAATDGALNALPTLCLDRARDHAKRLMAAPGGSPGTLGRLHGLPIAVKDNVDVGGVRCTSGSLAFEHRIAPANDVVVDRLEAAGAIVIGKSNLPEFAAGGTTHNEVFGTTYNPWDTTKTCGGSSGGSAAALAAGQVWLATGNDFAGSIRIPSSFCGTVGLRPTAGTVARIQRQAYSPLSVEGPMGRTVADVALMLDCQVGELGADPLSRPAPARTFLSAARAPALPARIAFSTDLGIAPMVDPEVARLCRTTASAMQVPGSRVEEACPDLQDADLVFQVLRSFLYVGRLAHIMDQHRDRMSPNVVWNTEQGLARSTREVVEADVAQAAIARRVVRFFDDHDLLLCPVAISPAFDARQQQLDEFGGVRFGFYYQWMMMTYAITVTACPSLAVPCGLTAGGLPIGMQLIGPPRSEHRLLAAGAWLEQQFGLHARVPLLPQTRKPVSDA
ncbi:MAG: amidase [Betaproteobacteria bacterium]|nr:amidase [Betaproteobacteria bacterium]